MTAIGALFHLLNFVLPAICVGGALALWARRYGKSNTLQAWLINSLVGILATALGLAFFGVDGKMLMYALLIVACGLSQLWLSRKN